MLQQRSWLSGALCTNGYMFVKCTSPSIISAYLFIFFNYFYFAYGPCILHILFLIYITGHYHGIVDILHKEHAPSILVSIYLCTDCQHVEIIFFFLIWVLRPFKEYFTYIELIVHQRWVKTGEPGEKPPDHP